jgi:hypothetical protein
MPTIVVERENPQAAHIEQLPATRDWMDQTGDKHAYQCFPLSLTNSLGWGISFPEDLVFIWDGKWDSTPDHVKIISGERFLHPNRGHATVSFNTGLTFRTDENTSTLVMPVPNDFNPYAQCFTTLMSTSFYDSTLPIAWTITRPDVEIVIPAGKPVAAVVPISLGALQQYEIEVRDARFDLERNEERKRYGEKVSSIIMSGKWSRLYKNGLNSKDEVAGRHETKKIILNTTYKD